MSESGDRVNTGGKTGTEHSCHQVPDSTTTVPAFLRVMYFSHLPGSCQDGVGWAGSHPRIGQVGSWPQL